MDFSQVTAYLDALTAGGVPSADLVIMQDHRQLYRHMAGWRDVNKTQPLRGDETYLLFSCTKVFTTCAAMQLIDRGKLNLDDPVSHYLPAYAHMYVKSATGPRPAQNVMTIRHLMSMQSGLNYDGDTSAIREALRRTQGQASTREIIDAKAQDPLEFEPGSDFLYSLGHDVLAVVIEEASGLRFSQYLEENIFAPLKLTTVGFEIRDKSRQCAQYMYNAATNAFDVIACDDTPYRYSAKYESGGAGLICDLRDYSVFADALACDGQSKDGTPLLSPAMIQLWSANQLGAQSRRTFDCMGRLGYSYALGVRTRVTLAEGGPGAIGEFGWDGAADSWVLIDPHRHLSAFLAMHVRNYPYAYDVIHPKLRCLIYEGLER